MLWASVGEGIAWEGNDWIASNFSTTWLGPMDPDYLNGKLMRMDWQGMAWDLGFLDVES